MGTAPTRLEPLLSLDIFICCFRLKSMSFSPRRLDASACAFVMEMKQGTDESQTRFQKPDPFAVLMSPAESGVLGGLCSLCCP